MTCLLDYKHRPQTKPLDFSGVSVQSLVGSCKAYRQSLPHDKVRPEHQAIEFYLLNAAAAELSLTLDHHEPLTPDHQAVLDRYYQALEQSGHRAFFYLFLICTREARHWQLGGQADLEKKYGKKLGFFNSIPDSSGEIMTHLETHPPEFSLVDFTELLVDVFSTGSFGGGFGGKNWAEVAKPLRDFVKGATTMEIFLDTVWTLAHNNGTIFNKGMLYNDANKAELLKILDVQRAGLVPNLVAHGDSSFVIEAHVQTLLTVRQVLSEFGVCPIDWEKVKALGAKGHYSAKPSKVLKPKDIATPPANSFQITPTHSVIKITRKEAK